MLLRFLQKKTAQKFTKEFKIKDNKPNAEVFSSYFLSCEANFEQRLDNEICRSEKFANSQKRVGKTRLGYFLKDRNKKCKHLNTL